MDEGNATVTCAWCGEAAPVGAPNCPHCGREPQPEGLTPLGGAEAVPLPPDQSPWGKPPSSGRDAREALERRRQEIAARHAQHMELSYLAYLTRVLKEDQVFAVLLGLMALNVLIPTVNAVLQASWYALPIPAFMLMMLIGLLTFQRIVHTILVWMAGAGLIMAGLNVVRLLIMPLVIDSGWQLFVIWLGWVLNIITMIFVLVVLCERNAYFEGRGSRPEPKRTRLREIFSKEYLSYALARPGDRPEEPSSPSRKAEMRSAPSQFTEGSAIERPGSRATMASMDEIHEPPKPVIETETAGTEELRPFGGGSVAKTTRGLEQDFQEARAADYRVDPLPPAPGERDKMAWEEVRGVLSWSYLKEMARQDPLFGWLLAALALQGVLTLARPNFWAIAGAAALIWGVLTLQQWGYYLALMMAGLQVFGHLVLLSVIHSGGGEVDAWVTGYGLVIVGLNLFIFIALLARRHLFE